MIARIALILLALCAIANADVRVSFPTGGDFRVGQLLPVVVEVDDPPLRAATITLRAQGALPTIVKMSGRARASAALLMLSGDGGDVSYSIDVKSESKCDVQLHDIGNELPQPRDTVNATGGVDAYAPVLAWHPGASARTKRMAILSGTLLAILFAGCATLFRGRSTVVIASVALTIVASLGISLWKSQIPPIWRAESQIIVNRADGTTQIDSWRYLTARSRAEAEVELPAGTMPVFVDLQQARLLDASLVFDAAANAKLHCILQRDLKLAVCNRRSAPTIAAAESLRNPPASPMLALAQRVYVDAQTAIVGERPVAWIDDQTIHWPAIVLAERK